MPKRLASVSFALVTVAAVPASQPNTNAAVYATLFNDHYWGLEPLSKLVVKNTGIPIPSLAGSNADSLKQWVDIPDALRRVAELLEPTTSVRMDAVLFPPGTRLIDASAVEAFFASPGPGEKKWPSFHRQFEAAGWVAFSDVVLTADHTNALVYYEGRCGGLYGVGFYVWLQRSSPESRWVIRKRILRWAS